MSIYEFQCDECGHRFDAFCDPHEEKRADCPECGRPARRLFVYGAFNIDWVNGGFHGDGANGDGLNFGLGKSFKSARERDAYAESLGLVRSEM